MIFELTYFENLDNILKNPTRIKLYKSILLNSWIRLENFQIKSPKIISKQRI